jgi:hypothetical protein
MATRGRPRGSHGTPAAKVAAVKALDDVGFSAAEIQRMLGDHSPPDRTVRSIVQQNALEDASGAWTPINGIEPSTSLGHVLDVLRVVVAISEGRRPYLTRNEAARIAQLAAAAPDLSPLNLFRLARLYMRRIHDKQRTEDLDIYLAFAPWRDDESAARYADVVKASRIATAPEYFAGAPKGDRNYDDKAVRLARLATIREELELDSVLFEEDAG